MKKIVFAIPFLVLSVAGWAQHKPERDPFVNLGQKQQQVQQETHTNVPVVTTRAHHKPDVRGETPPPKLNVLGLVTNSRQPKAIVASDKRTYIVAQGDQLGDYRVAKIDRSGITLACKQVRYHCLLGQ